MKTSLAFLTNVNISQITAFITIKIINRIKVITQLVEPTSEAGHIIWAVFCRPLRLVQLCLEWPRLFGRLLGCPTCILQVTWRCHKENTPLADISSSWHNMWISSTNQQESDLRLVSPYLELRAYSLYEGMVWWKPPLNNAQWFMCYQSQLSTNHSWAQSLSGGFTPCRHLRPSSGRENTVV